MTARPPTRSPDFAARSPGRPMSDQDVERLGADLADTPGLFAARRRKRAAGKLAALGTPEAVATLALALTRTTDPQVIELALRALGGVRDQPVVDAVAGAAVSTGDIRLATLLTGDGRAPSDPGPHAVLLFLAGHFDRYAELDYDGSLLRGAHTGAGETLRVRLAEKAGEAGRLEWVRAVTGDAGRRPDPLSESEWEAAVGVLEGAQEWEELWRLASDAPSTWAARILQTVGRRTWRPSAEADRSDFVKLVRLAHIASRQAVPTPGMFGDSDPRIISASPPVDYVIITRDGKTLISGGATTSPPSPARCRCQCRSARPSERCGPGCGRGARSRLRSPKPWRRRPSSSSRSNHWPREHGGTGRPGRLGRCGRTDGSPGASACGPCGGWL
jgi:hypothetical protein